MTYKPNGAALHCIVLAAQAEDCNRVADLVLWQKHLGP